VNLPAIVAEPGDRAEQLVAAFVEGRRSVHTRRAYRGDLLGERGWITWCRGAHVDPLGAEQAHVRGWLVDLEQLGDSEATRARRLAAASSWYRWLIRQRAASYNPADLDRGERPVVSRDESETLALSQRQVEQLVDQADADRDPRTAALVALLVYTGARVGELVAADVEDVTMQDGHPVLPITGKGRRRRTLALPPPVFARLDAYLRSRQHEVERLPALAAGARPRRPLLATSTGRRMAPYQVWRTLRALCRRAGGDLAALEQRMSPHVLRHTFASVMLADADTSLDEVQDALGHADPRTTRRYDHRHLDPANAVAYRMAGKIRTRRNGTGQREDPPSQSHT
jgi:integrase/recombinase XerD